MKTSMDRLCWDSTHPNADSSHQPSEKSDPQSPIEAKLRYQKKRRCGSQYFRVVIWTLSSNFWKIGPFGALPKIGADMEQNKIVLDFEEGKKWHQQTAWATSLPSSNSVGLTSRWDSTQNARGKLMKMKNRIGTHVVANKTWVSMFDPNQCEWVSAVRQIKTSFAQPGQVAIATAKLLNQRENYLHELRQLTFDLTSRIQNVRSPDASSGHPENAETHLDHRLRFHWSDCSRPACSSRNACASLILASWDVASNLIKVAWRRTRSNLFGQTQFLFRKLELVDVMVDFGDLLHDRRNKHIHYMLSGSLLHSFLRDKPDTFDHHIPNWTDRDIHHGSLRDMWNGCVYDLFAISQRTRAQPADSQMSFWHLTPEQHPEIRVVMPSTDAIRFALIQTLHHSSMVTEKNWRPAQLAQSHVRPRISPFDDPLHFQWVRHNSSNSILWCHSSIEVHLHNCPATGRILKDHPPERSVKSNSCTETFWDFCSKHPSLSTSGSTDFEKPAQDQKKPSVWLPPRKHNPSFLQPTYFHTYRFDPSVLHRTLSAASGGSTPAVVQPVLLQWLARYSLWVHSSVHFLLQNVLMKSIRINLVLRPPVQYCVFNQAPSQQTDHFIPASLNSQRTAAAGSSTSFQERTSKICHFQALYISLVHLPSRRDLSR